MTGLTVHYKHHLMNYELLELMFAVVFEEQERRLRVEELLLRF